MTILEFLASYAALFLQRAEVEGIPGVGVMYNEDEQGKAYAYVSNEHGGILIRLAFGLMEELTDMYKPELTDEQWDLFKENTRDPAA